MFKYENISKSYEKLKILDDFNLTIEKNEVTCLCGPSGCGKTTLLKIISGIDKNYEGLVSGVDYERVSFVFQESRLIPWLNVYENLKFVIDDKYDKEELDKIILEYLDKVNLLDFKHVYPNELSGGMKQRVSLARALVYPHDLLILDEPFQGLDEALKDEFILLLKKIIKEESRTVIMVTHQMNEARSLAHRIVFLGGQPLKIISQEDVKHL